MKRVSIRRGRGKSFIDLVAMITGIPMQDERTGTWYVHPAKVISYILTAPQWAPARITDRTQLSATANDVERSEKRYDSHLGEHWAFRGDRHFDELDHIAVIGAISEELTYRYRVFVIAGLHAPSENDEDQRPWYHIGFNMREVDANGFGSKARVITGKWTVRSERRWVSEMINEMIYERFKYLGEVDQTVYPGGGAEVIDLEDARNRRDL